MPRAGYAANVEWLSPPARTPCSSMGCPEAVVHDTGDAPTIASLVAWATIRPHGTAADKF